MKNIRRIIITSLFLTAGVLSACGTVHGVGKDVSSVGKDIQRAAR